MAATWFNSAVVRNSTVMPDLRTSSARRSGAIIRSLGTTTSVAPWTKVPHTSKVAASNDGFDAIATRSVRSIDR